MNQPTVDSRTATISPDGGFWWDGSQWRAAQLWQQQAWTQNSAIPFDDRIAFFARRGYRITNRTATSAQLVLPKRFSAGWAMAWFLLFGVGVFVYLAYYLAKRDTVVNLYA